VQYSEAAAIRRCAVSVAVEEDRIRRLLERVETVEDVANSMDPNDERRARLLHVSESALAEEGAIRPVIAAKLLGLSERTVRTWADAGVLPVVSDEPTLMLDLIAVHFVSHLIRELREAGINRDLVDKVAARLSDGLVSQDKDLRTSLEQMRRGEGRVLRAKSVKNIDRS
jgi:hypothetical protein